ncbi:UDP-2,4-diacetamido-2,4,6-trideoxy-beta-L-altropyranose hydrolase [Kangiella geojedonensis]|uniref:Polysaccharide biosynthesis protein n=1 Tax=Kangiella geojedonensis TaxID=914150 RepID=A0A0F6RCV4_9GAMM|nr:UDP-2,4-diacetamido-2,4,6-trideoxy-beta-L-altropyranose hydrolase [Kangiella geojedonensis]AKE52351.1 polysaccharide biosynthesis protein [Kangiella geojedonensis]
MKVVFRVDASTQMGSGHVMRCLTLANALRERGGACQFICREHNGNLIEFVETQGHIVHSLRELDKNSERTGNKKGDQELAHSSWLGATQEEDAAECQRILKSINPHWLIVDHYALDATWQKLLRPYYNKLMVIDDLADRHHLCDILLDQTYGREVSDYTGLVPEKCELLCGAQYALLRSEFTEWRNFSLARRKAKAGTIKNILINLGGVDNDNITSKILLNIADSDLPADTEFTVVMGATAPHIEAVIAQAHKMPWQTEVKVGVNNMAELMANSDLAIGAAGATSWERCCLGLPTIMIVIAENQRKIANELEYAGAAVAVDKNRIEHTSILVEKSLKPKQVIQLSFQAKSICDGSGTSRVIKQLFGKKYAY